VDVYLNGIVRYLVAQSWQIAALTLAVALAAWALRRRTAHIRYLLWLIVLARCLMPPVWAVPLRVLPERTTSPELVEAPVAESVAIQRKSPTRAAAAPQSPADPRRGPVQAHDTAEKPRDLHAWVGMAWIAGAGSYLILNVLRGLRGRRWLRKKRRPLPDQVKSEIQAFLAAHDGGVLPAIWVAENVGQPFVWGLVRGSIYVPASFLGIRNPEHRRHVLAHELSHVQRFDAAVNLLQIIAQGLFWFHPFVWWVNRAIRQEREKCCDEMAVARFGAEAKDYCNAVVETLASAESLDRPVPSLAVAGPAKNIEERIKTMLKPGKHFCKHPSPTVTFAILLAAVVTVPTDWVLRARAQVQLQAGERILHFPGDRLVGQLQIQEAGASRKLTYWFHWTGIEGPPWEDFGQARGDVRIPAGKQVRLIVNRLSLKDLSWLVRLGPNDLYSLYLPALSTNPAKTSDDCMPLISRLTGLRSLSLYLTAITDRGLSHITKLRSLEYLEAPPRMTDRGLAHVAKLPALKGLSVGASGGSPVTDAGLRHLSKLTSLEELYLRGEGMSDAGLAHIAGLPRLGYLALYSSRFTDRGMAHVKKIPSLRILSFHEGVCHITDAGLAHIGEMPKIELLLLDVTGPVTDEGIRHLAKMPSLRKLGIKSPLISDRGLEYLGQIKTLESLTLPQDQHGITDAGLIHLGQLPNLRSLGISRIHFNDPAMNTEYYTDRGLQALANCRRLESLSIGSPGITDAGMDHVAKLTHLKKLNLFGCDNVTEAGLAKLKTLPSLTSLSVNRAQVTISGINQLGAMKHLTRLDVDNLRRAGGILDLSGLTHLERLSLGFHHKSSDAFGDADLACLANLKTLKWLQIGPRDYTDAGLAHLAGLTNMERLNLGGSRLTGEGLKHLANMKNLDLLFIAGPFDTGKRNWSSGGHFTDQALRTLGQLKRMGHLQIHSDNTFSAAAIQRLREALPNLHILNLNGSDGRPTGMGARAAAPRPTPRVRQRTSRSRTRR